MASFGFFRRLKYGDPIVIVSGLPRSGTSMAMKMLERGGIELVLDGIRTADEDNPKGYFEDERVKDLGEERDKTWLKNVRGKAIKIVSSLLPHLPETNIYKIVFMRRDLSEVLASQAKMLERRGEANESNDEDMLRMYENHLEKVMFQIRFRPHLDAIFVHYRDVLENPQPQAERINEFLGGKLDVEKMLSVVDKSLYRNRS